MSKSINDKWYGLYEKYCPEYLHWVFSKNLEFILKSDVAPWNQRKLNNNKEKVKEDKDE